MSDENRALGRQIRPCLVALTLLGSALLTACRGTPNPTGDGTDLLTGYVEAEMVYVAAPASGWLTASMVREGDTVSPEDLLFELESDLEDAELEEATGRLRQSQAQARDLATGARAEEVAAIEGQLAEARASLELARLEHQRMTVLAKEGVVAQERADQAIAEFKAAQARVRTLESNIEVARLAGRQEAREAAMATAGAAEAAVRQARWRLDQRRIQAKVGGRVEEVFHRTGEFVTAGSPVLSLLPEGALEARFFVPQADLSRVEPGSPVEVLIDASGQEAPRSVPARVTFVARQAEFTPPVIYSAGSREKLVFLVRARFLDPAPVRPGQPVDVRLP